MSENLIFLKKKKKDLFSFADPIKQIKKNKQKKTQGEADSTSPHRGGARENTGSRRCPSSTVCRYAR